MVILELFWKMKQATVNKKKEKLIVLSDLWGFRDSPWLINYQAGLDDFYKLSYWDVCQIAGLPTTPTSQEERHQFFIHEGIDTVVAYCHQQIKEPVNILAFSIGGTIAWRAGLAGVPIKKLYAVSATRLRYETQCPPFPIQLIYGDQDEYRPDNSWLQFSKTNYSILKQTSHQVYKQKEYIPFLLANILAFLK